ncbi:MAG TPA: N-acetyltransferase [Hyphomicrobiaceae bacterium]|nr:N-acetyltransferase [Hyphomicrobiaceae bacterium]
MSSELTVRRVTGSDLPAVLALHARVFGPGRFVRTAYRIREGTPAISRFCLLAVLGGELVAAIRFTEVTIGGEGGALLLGPLAVEPRVAGRGYGKRIVADGMESARRAGLRLVLLVGDLSYYGRFGFTRVPPGQIVMPGPVDPDRLLAAELVPGALDAYRGIITAR